MNYDNFRQILGNRQMTTYNLAKTILLLTLALGLTSCGPEKSQLDLERETKAERINQKASENQRLVGNYTGTVSYNGTELGTLLMDLHRQDELSNPNELDPTFIPTLQGTLWVSLPGVGSLSTDADPYWDLNISRVAYDGDAKVSILAASPLATTSTISINGSFNGTDTIKGTFYAKDGIKIPNIGRVNSADVVLNKK